MNLEILNKYRMTSGQWKTNDNDKFGLFFVKYSSHINHPPLKVIAAPFDDPPQGWEHISVSLPNRCPNWKEMCFIKDLFWPKDQTVIQFHPKESEYVNNHPWCLHLWRNVNQEVELPPSELVGIK